MHDADELWDTLKSFWMFMLFFALILAGVIGYVNLLGALEKVNFSATQTIVKEFDIDLPDRMLLKIKCKERGGGLVSVDTGDAVASESETPYFEFYGDGIIEVAYSHDKMAFYYEPKFFPFPHPLIARDTARLYGSVCLTLHDSVDVQRVRNDGNAAKLSNDIAKDMRDLTRIYKQYVYELYPDIHENYEGYWRLVYVSHIFVTLYDKNDPTRAAASATIRITSNDEWAFGVAYDDRVKSAFAALGVSDEAEAHSGTFIELVSYWQADN